MKDLLKLYIIFFKIGITTFGGGYAMLPLLEREVVENKGWATKDEILDFYGISQCTPGIIAINTATFVGYKIRGVIGGIFATMGMISPSIIIISIIATYFGRLSGNPSMENILNGVNIAVIALIFSTVKNMYRTSIKRYKDLALFLVATIGIGILKLSPVIMVLLGISLGIIKYVKEVRKWNI